jgi:hypothetical protein
MAGSFLLLAQSAGATHELNFTFTLANTAKDANSNVATHLEPGAYLPKDMTFHLPPGVKVAHADDATSPVTPPPQDNDIVGEGDSTAKWVLMFCASSTSTLTARWQEPVDSGAPSGTVAQIDVSNAIGFTTKVFVVNKSSGDSYHAGAHYDLVIPDYPDQHMCSSTTNHVVNLTTYGTVSGTNPLRKVAQNPSTCSTITAYVVYNDNRTPSGAHSDSDTETITGC